jgi:hypothetical protein
MSHDCFHNLMLDLRCTSRCCMSNAYCNHYSYCTFFAHTEMFCVITAMSYTCGIPTVPISLLLCLLSFLFFFPFLLFPFINFFLYFYFLITFSFTSHSLHFLFFLLSSILPPSLLLSLFSPPSLFPSVFNLYLCFLSHMHFLSFPLSFILPLCINFLHFVLTGMASPNKHMKPETVISMKFVALSAPSLLGYLSLKLHSVVPVCHATWSIFMTMKNLQSHLLLT